MKPFLAITAYLALAGAAQAQQAETYLLNDQDTISLRVGQWNLEERNFDLWDGLSGEYRVGPDGYLSVPLVGSIPAEGKSVSELSETIARLVQINIGLPQPPAVAMDIAAYKPIYVGGSVNRPGEYPYRYGMTIQQAIAVAGGPPRLDDPEETNEREAIRLRGDIEAYRTRIARLEAEQERYLNELASYATAEESGNLPAVELLDAEGLEDDIQDANRNSLVARKENIESLRQLLEQQISRLGAEIALRDEQIRLAREELDGASQLKERGLAVNARLTALTSAVSDLESKRIQLEVAKLTAEQQLNLAQRDALTLLDEARLRRLSDLKESRIELDELRVRLATTLNLYNEAISRGLIDDQVLDLPQPKYFVTRENDAGGFDILELEATARLSSGDTLQVVIDSGFDTPAN
ncbi:polysaccharide biosynthesis/export family protein [Oceanomicrobium pacificus]|uniref:Uncharacterized protein n=1 Tax=Oceanomicrobium pacificus TaxID=2692916 RepID=A0A6B0TVG3_9RHOB|nr:polysaccharide biosynthesis/export family protein [Oceanomicrobium pacificus]MXU65212.1 hypothetical protein [Oceanomicrobium pacificus]